jgi:hypothetical protein
VIRTISVLLLLLLLASGTAEAQGPVVKYGKWLLVAGSIGMNYFALRSHNRADDAFNALEARCLANHARCALSAGGQYTDPEIEGLYQTSLRQDRVARGWLIGGETALAGAAVLFIWELTRPKGRPRNIPFEPEVRSMRWGTGVGLRLAF